MKLFWPYIFWPYIYKEKTMVNTNQYIKDRMDAEKIKDVCEI